MCAAVVTFCLCGWNPRTALCQAGLNEKREELRKVEGRLQDLNDKLSGMQVHMCVGKGL